jgi:uncharacterized protein (TIGR04255 family)
VTLDYDCYRADPGDISEVPAFLRRAHAVIEDAFFSMITDQYLGYLKGVQ